MKFLKSISLFCLIALLFAVFTQMFISSNTLPSKDKVQMEEMTVEGEVDLTVSTKQNVTTCDTEYEVEAYIGKQYILVKKDTPVFRRACQSIHYIESIYFPVAIHSFNFVFGSAPLSISSLWYVL